MQGLQLTDHTKRKLKQDSSQYYDTMYNDLLSTIIAFSPDVLLCKFLLVSRRARKIAFEQCKARSLLPHLWDVDRNELMTALYISQRGLLEIIHTDYNLCAVLGVCSQPGVLLHLTTDLYRLAARMIPTDDANYRNALAVRAAQLGLYEVFKMTDEPATYDKHLRAYMKWSPSAEISTLIGVSTHSWKRLYEAIHSRNRAVLTSIPIRKTAMPRATLVVLAVWLVRLNDPVVSEIVHKHAGAQSDKLTEFIKIEIDAIGLPSKLRHTSSNRYIWDIHTIRNKQRYYEVIICIDDPTMIQFCDPETLVVYARYSCCKKIVAACNVPDTTTLDEFSWSLDKDLHDPIIGKLAIAYLCRADPVKLFVWVKSMPERSLLLSNSGGHELWLRSVQHTMNYCASILDAASILPITK